MIKQAKQLSLFALLYVMISVNLYAQEKINIDEDHSKWNFVIEPYMMFPNMSGETGIGEVLPSVEVDANVGDIFGHLKFGAMLYAEAGNDKWTITSDLLYMKLEQDIKTNQFVTGGDITMQQLAWEVAGLRRVMPWLDAGIGLRLMSLDMEINATTLLNDRSASTNETWVDPIIVARTQGLINNKWIYKVRGDFGGFGIGSNFSWQLQADFGYRFSELFYTTLGYRIIGVDYDNGSGADRFLYDINTFGAVVRFGFNL
jgi:hypothetical protein